ncbi:Hpt domain-containing protein [Arthrobacter sp. PsM3]|uniref:Hpt domain-containing protein n=1 Tax=Arthrobacter sp. PsM3 TaxID=3030531 RepID=UPI00263AD871|nr:Hpt domain-containing protein [Arthrobacter sp. PsM3]MDN4643060.1 Hpt domain-containing protein [Arthrobacter sp. PsM3]
MNRPLPGAPGHEHERTKAPSGVGAAPTPVLNPGELQSLIDHVGPAAAARFADDFLDLLEDRLIRVDDALSQSDPVSALNAVLVLKASSAMLGAEQLTLFCSGLEAELRGQRMPHAGALARLAADFASAVRAVIASTFPRDASGPVPRVGAVDHCGASSP